MTFPTIDVLLKKINNKYLLANAIAERAKEIGEGSIPYIEDPNPLNPIETAMEEFGRGKVDIKILESPPQKAVKPAETDDFWARESGAGEKESRRKRSKASESLEKETRKKSKTTKSSKKK